MHTRSLTLTGLAVAALAATAVAVPTVTNAAPQPTVAPAAAPAAATPTLPTRGLDILLTNDDGYEAPGIQAVYAKLTAAGHHVTMSAPDKNNSGVSARVSFGGPLEVISRGENQWSTSGSPVTSAIFGLEHLFADEKPDLVISGTNVGANTGFDTNYSGTVGAATVAAGAYDLPAIAVSTDVIYGQEATGAYDQTADLLVEMIASAIPDLPRGQLININYPTLSASRTAPAGITYAANSQASQAAFSFAPPASGTTFTIVPGRSTEVPEPGSDAAVLKDGYVSVGVLDADRSVPASQTPAVAALVRKLNNEKPLPPVTPAKPSVEKLPARVLAGSRQWVRASGLDTRSVTVVWKGLKSSTQGKSKGKKPKKPRTVTRTARVTNGLFSLKAPRKGTYQVKVRAGGKVLRTAKVRVL